MAQDIASIDDFLEQLDRDAAQGFDVGSSQETLLFQRSTLQIDLDFYQQKIYDDLYGFTDGIVKAAVEIEPNPMNKAVEEIRERKMSGVRPTETDADVSFAIGNLLMNLESQKTKLTLEFKGYTVHIRQFLEQNKRFAVRCLKRVQMISNEIVTEQEMSAKEASEAAEKSTIAHWG